MKIFAYIMAALVTLAGAGVVQAQSSSDTHVVHGTVERVDHAANRVFVRGDDGRDYAVDISQGHATGNARTVGQEVTVYGRRTGDNRIEATNITADRDYRSASAADRGRYRPSGWDQVHGSVQEVDGSTMRLRTDEGQMVRVNISGLPERREELVSNLRPGAAVTVIGAGDSRGDRFMARHIRFDDRDLNRRAWGGGQRGGQRAAATNTAAGDVTINGKVETIHKDTMHVRTSDGRLVVVDIDPVREGQRERFEVGHTVTVVGAYKDGKQNQMVARSVRRDGGPAGSRASSARATAPSGEQRVQGTIETIHNDNLRLKADDGRSIRVNIDPVRDNVRERIKVGQRVTVVGVYTDRDANPNVMTARTVRVDDNASASPGAANRPRNADDCRDRGWQNYSNPRFKNQGECVSYVNTRK